MQREDGTLEAFPVQAGVERKVLCHSLNVIPAPPKRGFKETRPTHGDFCTVCPARAGVEGSNRFLAAPCNGLPCACGG